MFMAQFLSAQGTACAFGRFERIDPFLELIHIHFERVVFHSQCSLPFTSRVSFLFQLSAFGYSCFRFLEKDFHLFNFSF